MPPAPMPPPPPHFASGGGFPPPGAIHANDWPAGPAILPIHDEPIRGSPPPLVDFYDDDYDAKPNKKGKNRDKDKASNAPVEVQFRGYNLEKAEPRLGEKYSWARVGKRALPFDDVKLQAIVKNHRLKTRSGPASDLSRLTSNQQGIVDRLVAEHRLKEKDKNADWVLSDVQRFGTWHWRSLDVKRIQVILKRQDKNLTKPGDRTTGHNSSSYSFGEIIDLAEPLREGKKDKDKDKNKKNKHVDDMLLDDLDDPLGPGLPALNNDFGYNDHHQHQQQPAYEPPMQPVGQPYGDPFQNAPPGSIPIPPQQHQHQQNGYPDQNPFMPEPHLVMPGQYDAPLEYHHRSPRRITRSPSRPRRRSSSARRIRKLENEVDDLRNKIDDWRVSDNSSEEQYEGNSVFSHAQSGAYSTPPSTPPRSEAYGPRGSLHRSKSRPVERRYRDEPRERRYENGRVEVQPASSFRPRRDSGVRHREEERQRREPRYDAAPRLHRSQTYDDYPVGRVAEPRYLPPPRIQRRLTDFGEGYQDADFDDQYRRRRDSARRATVFDPVHDAYEAGRRDRGYEDARPGRRRSVIVESSGGYYR